jgi:hypothetical protein
VASDTANQNVEQIKAELLKNIQQVVGGQIKSKTIKNSWKKLPGLIGKAAKKE